MKNLRYILMSLAASLFLASGLLAQEQVEVQVKVTKDGKVVTDTTYKFEDALEAEQVLVMKSDDDVKVEMRKILEEHDGEEDVRVKVIVIEKEEKDHAHDADHDHDEDHDVDQDRDVEVKVVKKKIKK